MRFKRCLLGTALLASAGLLVAQETKPAVPGPESVVQAQVESYNRRDIDAFLKTYSPDFRLYDFSDKGLSVGLEPMRATYGKLFADNPVLKVKIAKRIVQGDYVIDHEEVSGVGGDQKAVAIYRVKEGKITAVWFLP